MPKTKGKPKALALTATDEQRTRRAKAVIKETRKDVGAGRFYNKLDKEKEDAPLSFHELVPPPTFEQAMAEDIASAAGRPTLYKPDYHPRLAYQILTRTPGVFLTMRVLAPLMGLTRGTFEEWMRVNKEFSSAITHARAYQEASMAHHLTTTKYAQGTFYALKNMHSEYWKDKIEHDTTVKLGEVIQRGEEERNAVAWKDVIDVPVLAVHNEAKENDT